MKPPPSPSLFRDYLYPGERIRWTGTPKHGLILRGLDIILIPLSLLWIAFVIFWNIGVRTAPLDFRLFGLVFLLIGIYFVFGRFIHDAAIRARLVYAVTDRRVLILRQTPWTKLTVINLDHLLIADFTQHRDSTGTIKFVEDPSFFSARTSRMDWWTPSLVSTQLIRIEQSKHVYDLLGGADA
jgi:hypothetical protein